MTKIKCQIGKVVGINQYTTTSCLDTETKPLVTKLKIDEPVKKDFKLPSSWAEMGVQLEENLKD